MNEVIASSAVPLGRRLRGRFELVEVIGEGGISTVYRAIDHIGVRAGEKSPEVAVKLVQPHAARREELTDLLHREARLLRDLVHQNLVRVYDSDHDDHYHFLVMELLRGRSLATIMNDRRGRPLSLDVSLRIVRSVGDGLEHMHRLGIIHGDLKPGNVFMTTEGEVKIIDFGMALAVDAAPPPDNSDTTAHLLDRVGLMTPAYSSLEMLAGEPRTESDDVYSLAVLAYLALTGKHPFERCTAEEAQRDGLCPVKPPGLPPDQWRALAAGLALSRKDRVATVGQFTRALVRPRWRERLFGM
jgi:serine/threonine protein kinase